MQCEYLKNSDEIREKIAYLFASKGRKIVIVAFVGSNAIDYIPNKDNLQIYCWPNSGATSANGIRLLQQKGVKIFFSDNMHKKIYWAENRGTIITSANLTYNALSGNVLQESGVFIPSNDFDIDAEVSHLRNIRLAKNEEIDDLERKARITGVFLPSIKDKVMTFREFMNLSCKPKIKILNYCDERSQESKKEIKDNIQSEQKLKTVKVINDNDVENVDCFDVGDIVLQVKTFTDIKDNDTGMIHRNNMHPLRWLFVDATTYSEEDESYLVAQIKPNREIPFDINEADFVSAFKEVFNSTDWKYIIDKRSNVKESFWVKVLRNMDLCS